MTTKEAVRQLIDRLTDDDLAAAEAFIQFLEHRRRLAAEPSDPLSDPLLAMLQAAPEDDEPMLPGEDDGDAETWKEYQHGDFLSAGQAQHHLLKPGPPRFSEGSE